MTNQVTNPIKKPLKKKVEEKPIEKEDWKRFQKKEEIQHILDRPDTFIGSTEIAEPDKSVKFYFLENEKISTKKDLQFIPGLYKIFDECLVNAADNVVKTRNMKGDNKTTRIKVTLTKTSFSIENNGEPIPVQMHEEEKLWVPELIFGNLRTSDNYDDSQERLTGGRNGYGAKLAVIFSTQTNICIVDKKRKKKYTQSFDNNMGIKHPPVIVASDEDNMVKVECFPDFSRFENSSEFSDDMFLYLHRRAYDVAATTPSYVSVYINEVEVGVKTFRDYVKLYEPEALEEDIIYTKPTSLVEQVKQDKSEWVETDEVRWEVAFVKTEQDYRQVSFVNNINTFKGGKHVNYVTNKIKTYLHDKVKVKHPHLKKDFFDNYMHIYVNCKINQPKFDSQCKENMTSQINQFGSKFEFSREFLKEIENTKIIDNVLDFANFKEDQKGKQLDGKKSVSLKKLEKLHDAPNAGKKNLSSKCVLILTEGLSACGLALAGLSAEQRKFYGVYPLRGKVLNVRDVSNSCILKNAEISDIKTILGLSQNQVITNISELRYGSVMFMTDQDKDGFHIKGLLMNLFDSLWSSTYAFTNFFGSIRTPILKATLNKITKSFYTEAEYKKWTCDFGEDHKKWSIKYYKGLGTSKPAEAIEYFSNLDKNVVYYNSENVDELTETKEKLDMVFNEKRANDRKKWLAGYDPESEILYNENNSTNYTTFFDKEFIHFSNYDNERSIPSLLDGFKTGQRKIMYGVIKKNLKEEIKVAVLCGYITEKTHYHHGEASLYSTIVNMAQVFVGANNINCLLPEGIFGSRMYGGKDAASARYIETKLNPLVAKIFRSEDNPVLEYTYTENDQTEPVTYYPIIPMILVNGSVGIGTGYSTNIPSYNPSDLIENMKLRLAKKEYKEIHPYYTGFSGNIKHNKNAKKITTIDEQGVRTTKVVNGSNSYTTSGKYQIDGDVIHITELPIGTWVVDYKKHLDEYIIDKQKTKDQKELDKQNKQFILSYDEICTDYCIDITLYTDWNRLQELIMTGKLDTVLKLDSKLSTSNMVLFNQDRKLKKYKYVTDIIEEFYHCRYAKYQERKAYQLCEMTKQIQKLSERIRFLTNVMEEQIIVFKKSNKEVTVQLEEEKFEKFDDSFDYLLSMPIGSFTKEKLDKLLKEKTDTEAKMALIGMVTVEELWNQELDELADVYKTYLDERKLLHSSDPSKNLKKVKKDAKKKKKIEKLQ